MEKLLENFTLKEEVEELLDCYFNPPFGWNVYRLGFYKYNGKLHSFCCYKGQEIEEPIYNWTAEYIIDILEDIDNYFDTSSNLNDYTKNNVNNSIDCICENVLEQIKEFEKEF